MNYNKIFGFSLAVAILALSVTPALAMDISGQVKANRQNHLTITTTTQAMLMGSRYVSSTAQNRAEGNFCTYIAKFSQNLKERLTERTATVKTHRAETITKLTDKRKERNEKRTEIKDDAQDKRLKNYDKLLEHATNDELKAAVEKFKTAVNTAIENRRAAVESANTVFRAAVDAAMTERKGLIESATAEYKTAVDNARTAAVSACAVEGADGATVRTEMQTALQAAKDAFKTKKSEIEKIKVDLEPARAAHKAAIEKAISDFKVAMDAARADLKAAFLTFGEKLPEAQKPNHKPVATTTVE